MKYGVDKIHNNITPSIPSSITTDASRVTYVANQLELRYSFFGPFLCAIALPAPEAAAAAAPGGARCLLPRLDIGEEKPIQQLIAAFTGVPIGSSWRFVQLAAAHLAPHLHAHLH